MNCFQVRQSHPDHGRSPLPLRGPPISSHDWIPIRGPSSGQTPATTAYPPEQPKDRPQETAALSDSWESAGSPSSDLSRDWDGQAKYIRGLTPNSVNKNLQSSSSASLPSAHNYNYNQNFITKTAVLHNENVGRTFVLKRRPPYAKLNHKEKVRRQNKIQRGRGGLSRRRSRYTTRKRVESPRKSSSGGHFHTNLNHRVLPPKSEQRTVLGRHSAKTGPDTETSNVKQAYPTLLFDEASSGLLRIADMVIDFMSSLLPTLPQRRRSDQRLQRHQVAVSDNKLQRGQHSSVTSPEWRPLVAPGRRDAVSELIQSALQQPQYDGPLAMLGALLLRMVERDWLRFSDVTDPEALAVLREFGLEQYQVR